jgi:hypothetical protein
LHLFNKRSHEQGLPCITTAQTTEVTTTTRISPLHIAGQAALFERSRSELCALGVMFAIFTALTSCARQEPRETDVAPAPGSGTATPAVTTQSSAPVIARGAASVSPAAAPILDAETARALQDAHELVEKMTNQQSPAAKGGSAPPSARMLGSFTQEDVSRAAGAEADPSLR